MYNKILRDRDDNIEKFEDLIKMIDYKYIDRLNKKIDLSSHLKNYFLKI